MKNLLFLILSLNVMLVNSQNSEFKEWSAAKIKQANTAENINYLGVMDIFNGFLETYASNGHF
jgi:hypothetical protein